MGRAFAALLVVIAMALGTTSVALAASKATVNGVEITDMQVNQRLRLFTLEGRSGARAALDELVDEALIMQEARRLDVQVSESQVDDAFQNVARNVRVSVDNLRTVLQQNGVNVDTLRDRLRAAIAWNAITQRAIMPRIQISDAELEQQAAARIDPSKEFDYILKEVLFVIPGGQGSASQRTAQAEQYRRGFQSCDSAVQLSLSYTDAAVIDLGRRHATQLPDAIAKELSQLNVGGITKPRVVENGVSMLAVCAKSVAEDTSFIKSQLRQEAGNEQVKAEQDTYLKDLRARARIIYN